MDNWVDVTDYEEFYRVSDRGVVWSKRQNKPLRPSTGKGGYLRVILYGSPRAPKTASVHKVVKNSFHGATPEGLLVLHNDGNPGNNQLDNLRFGTPRENMLDKQRHGTDPHRNRTHCPRGHLLAEPNLRPSKLRLGWRGCRACHQARSDRFNGHVGSLSELADARYEKIMNPVTKKASH